MYSKIILGHPRKDGTTVELKSYLDAEQRHMTRDETELFMRLTIIEQRGGSAVFDELIASSFISRIINDRLHAFSGHGASKVTIVIADMWSRGVPGCGVMWAFTLFTLARKLGQQVQSMDFVRAFNSGVPTDTSLQSIWGNQKGDAHGIACDNLLNVIDWRALVPYLEVAEERIEGYKSFAQWPHGDVSDDKHSTESAAVAACETLALEGFGGASEVFPMATWVEPILKQEGCNAH
jgi:hypothetical protein